MARNTFFVNKNGNCFIRKYANSESRHYGISKCSFFAVMSCLAIIRRRAGSDAERDRQGKFSTLARAKTREGAPQRWGQVLCVSALSLVYVNLYSVLFQIYIHRKQFDF